MPSRDSDSIVLRCYPYREADLIVSFFARERGKLRGIARNARRPKSQFGSALERLVQCQVHYFQKERRELVNLRRAELRRPTNLWKANYPTSIALDVIAEAADRLLPAHEPHDAFFRLLRLVSEEFSRGIATGQEGDPLAPWAHRSLVYFLLWSARLGGWLPPLDRCCESDQPFHDLETTYFSAEREGLFRARFRTPDSWPFPSEARTLAQAMLRARLDHLSGAEWPAAAALALQRFLLQRTQAQLENHLHTAATLGGLWSSRSAPG